MLTLMRFLKFRIVIFLLRVGSPTDHTSSHLTAKVYWDPNLPSWETKGEMCPRANFTHHIPQLLHAYLHSFRFISVPSEGATPKTDTRVLCLCFFSCPCLSSLACFL